MNCKLISPLYDIEKSYLENAEQGPFFNGSIPKRTHYGAYDFLGHLVSSRIGVPAGPLLNSKWIKLAADLHYDILCYKTIRTKAYDGHPLPNIVFIDADTPLFDDNGTLSQRVTPPNNTDSIAITNSFGMPSRSREYLEKDIPKANTTLHKGQVMIVSVVGSADSGDLLKDFVDAALLAKECGANIIEVNYSCPNVASKEGSLYLDPSIVFSLTQMLVKSIHPIPLIVKVGCYPNNDRLKDCCIAIAKGGARAIAGINTISKKVVNQFGEPALGPNRLVSGICGSPIKSAALQFIQNCRDVIDSEQLDMKLIGCGGITLPTDFDVFFDAGADFATTATGMMWNPYLATEYHLLNSKEMEQCPMNL